MSQKLVDLDSAFWIHHYALIDLIDDDESLVKEQDVLDTHDDLVAELTVCVKLTHRLRRANPHAGLRHGSSLIYMSLSPPSL